MKPTFIKTQPVAIRQLQVQ